MPAAALVISDPERQAILMTAEAPDQRLRLLLGSDAYAVPGAADEAKIASDDR